MSGSPFTNAQSDINQFVLNELRSIRTDMNQKFEDLSNKIDGKKTISSKYSALSDYKQHGITTFIAFLVTTIMTYFKPAS